MIQVYSLKMNRELSDAEREDALNILTPERKAKALRFRRFKDQNRSIAAGLLEGYAIRQTIGDSLADYTIEKGAEGKPYLMDYPDVFYNISHAGDYVVCAIGTEPVGIDVEQADKYSESVVKRFFQKDEIEDILGNADEAARKDAFAEYWVMKESFMKLSGAGFSVPLKSFYSNRRTGVVRLCETVPERWRQELIDMGMTELNNPVCQFVPLETGYSCAICTLGKTCFEHRMIEWRDVLDKKGDSKSSHRQNG